MQHLEDVVGREDALHRLRRRQRLAGGELVVGNEIALLQKRFQPGEPELVIAHGEIVGRVAVLACETPHVDVPAARHAHGERQREGAAVSYTHLTLPTSYSV